MKRIMGLLISLSMVLSLTIETVAAQEDDERVLQKARGKYEEQLKKDTSKHEEASVDNTQEVALPSSSEISYTPLLLSFVPGLSMPMGYHRTTASFAAIGATFEASYGFTGAGVFNIYNTGRGFQGAGVFNISEKRIEGLQGAGVFNIAGGDVDGLQGAGVFNIARGPVRGAQAAGVFNLAITIKGIQFAEVFNVAESVEGVQIGLVNIATEELRGFQIGLINISPDRVDSLSYIYMPETDMAFAYLQTGSPFLYILLGAGAPRSEWFVRNDNLIVSAGLGTRIKMEGSYLDIDISAEQAIGKDIEAWYQAGLNLDKELFISYLNPYPSSRISLGIPLGRTLHLTGGIKTVVQLEEGGKVPHCQKSDESFSGIWFGVPFTAWFQWFVGAKVTL